MRNRLVALLVTTSVYTIPLFAGTKPLLDFESPSALRLFEFKKKSGRIVNEHATKGTRALAVKNGEYMVCWRKKPLLGDWSGFDVLKFDYFNATAAPVKLYILIGDQAWRTTKGGTYWNRFNGGGILLPGAGTFTLPVSGLYRGEAGSRNNDIKRNIDINAIVRMDLGFKGKDGDIFIDNLRLESAAIPEFVKAFDFGPVSQPLEPGFTVVSWNSIYSDALGFGFDQRRRPWGSSRARDDTFPTPLFQDFVEARHSTFMVSLPDGKYRVWLVFDDLGYWGGEQPRHHQRSIKAGNTVVYKETRPQGWAAALYDFEDVEALPGTDMWKTYMERLFRPKEFNVVVTRGKLKLSFLADAPWSSKVAAMIIYPWEKRKEGQAFTDKIWAKQRKVFLSKAVEMGNDRKAPSPRLRRIHPLVFHVKKDESITPYTMPDPSAMATRFRVSAAMGEYEPIVFGLRANKKMEDVRITLGDLVKNNGAKISHKNIKPRVAFYLARRGFNSIAYRFSTHTLRPAQGFSIPAGITRQAWVDIKVPKNAQPGDYKSTLNISWQEEGAQKSLTRPVTLTVMRFTLHDTPFNMGFYGITPPRHLDATTRRDLQNKIFAMLKDYGMNTFSGGPNVLLKGFKAGEPVLDFTAADDFMQLARSHGFDRPYMNYGGGGISGLYNRRYVIGDIGSKLAQQAGLPYEAALKKVLDAYRKHAASQNYLPMILGLVDETRVVEQAREQIKLQKAFRRAAPWLTIGGSYSVSFAKQPKNELTRLLQEFFRTLNVNVMNRHDQSVLDAAKKQGSEVWIYNQGQSRYTFGFYQWAEFAKGVKGRMQWHLFIQHGWQYFDLDGREPDTGVIAYHSKLGIIPTLNLARCREGIDDLLYCQTLSDLVKANPRHPQATQAKTLLTRITTGIKVNENRKPEWLDQDKVRSQLAKLILALSNPP